MNYKVEVLPLFEKEAKRLYKKYPSIKKDLTCLIKSLQADPVQGVSLGNGFYKIRMASPAKEKGKAVERELLHWYSIFQGPSISLRSMISPKKHPSRMPR